MNINLEYYRIFYYVGKTGKITEASKILSISQPAVSQAIKVLEEAWKTPLFIRLAKGVRLTAEGELLYSYVKRGYESIELGETKLREMMNLESGKINIGASDMTLRFYLLPFLETFHKKYPHIKVSVSNGPTPDTLKTLQDGNIDFGVVSSPYPAKQGMKEVKVKTIEDIFVAGKAYEELRNKTLHYNELDDFSVICLEKNTSSRKHLDEYLRVRGLELYPEFELATSDMIVQFAIRNLGIGLVVKEFAEEYIEKGDLFQLKFREMVPKRNFCIVWDERYPISNAAKNLLLMMMGEEEFSNKNL
ncbi:MAG TPA: LysR family transcriptional regulator [Candidatus Merdenecus merdavium]|nr:LysR family transcriptional regulator [Candidatus Merdenecus merdavium]